MEDYLSPERGSTTVNQALSLKAKKDRIKINGGNEATGTLSPPSPKEPTSKNSRKSITGLTQPDKSAS